MRGLKLRIVVEEDKLIIWYLNFALIILQEAEGSRGYRGSKHGVMATLRFIILFLCIFEIFHNKN